GGPRTSMNNYAQNWIRLGSLGLAQDLSCCLDFPEELFGLGLAPVVEVFDINDMQATEPFGVVIRLDSANRCQAVSHVNSLADLWILTGLDVPHVSALGTLIGPGSLIRTLGSKRSSSMESAV